MRNRKAGCAPGTRCVIGACGAENGLLSGVAAGRRVIGRSNAQRGSVPVAGIVTTARLLVAGQCGAPSGLDDLPAGAETLTPGLRFAAIFSAAVGRQQKFAARWNFGSLY